MPVYNADATSVNKPVLTPSRPITLWDDELPLTSSPAAPASQQFCMHRDGFLPHTVAVEIQFDGDPGVFRVDLEVADTDDDDFYVTKASLTTGLNGSFVGRIEATNVVAKFGRLNMVTNTNGVAVTARVS